MLEYFRPNLNGSKHCVVIYKQLSEHQLPWIQQNKIRSTCLCLDSCLCRPQAQLIAQSIGQAFSVAYQEFLRANGINPEDLSQKEYSDIINTQEMYNDDLIHFSNSENCKEVSLYKVCTAGFYLQMLFLFSCRK